MLTVLMATRNRGSLLRRVLTSYLELKVPDGGWKIVLVDNGSTDDTRHVVGEYADKLPLEYVFEAESGQAKALNRGLEIAEGDLVVKTDDDTFPEQNWLILLRKAADENPGFGVFGGSILPKWERMPTGSFHTYFPQAVLYALTDQKMEGGLCAANLIFGPNMAIRKEFFDRGYRFDENQGPSGRSYPMGNETALLMRLNRAGVLAWFVPEARVHHYIRREQLKAGWIFRRAVNFGRGQCLKVVKSEDHASPVVLGVPRYMLKRMLLQLWVVTKTGVRFQWAEVSRALWQLMFLKGFIEESRHHSWRM